MISTVEPFFIRGLDTAYGAFVGGEPRSGLRRSVVPFLILAEDPLTGADALAAASRVVALVMRCSSSLRPVARSPK